MVATSSRDTSRKIQKSSRSRSRFSGIVRENSTSFTGSDRSLELNPIRNSQFQDIKPSYMSDWDTSSSCDGSEADLLSTLKELLAYLNKQHHSSEDHSSPAETDEKVKDKKDTIGKQYIVIVKDSVAVHSIFFGLSVLLLFLLEVGSKYFTSVLPITRTHDLDLGSERLSLVLCSTFYRLCRFDEHSREIDPGDPT